MEDHFIKERKRIKSVFNLAALIYPLIELSLIPQYRKAMKKLPLHKNLNVIDFGTGTGILAGTLHEQGHILKGIDFSRRLLKRAGKKYPGIKFEFMDLFDMDIEKMDRVDMVTMGYLLHGLSPDMRKIILRKAAVLSKQYVLIFDHSARKNIIVEIIEFLEGSYYREFIHADHKQMISQAGLNIVKEFNAGDFGYCWLCEK